MMQRDGPVGHCVPFCFFHAIHVLFDAIVALSAFHFLACFFYVHSLCVALHGLVALCPDIWLSITCWGCSGAHYAPELGVVNVGGDQGHFTLERLERGGQLRASSIICCK
jgi:hypothetical protein